MHPDEALAFGVAAQGLVIAAGAVCVVALGAWHAQGRVRLAFVRVAPRRLGARCEDARRAQGQHLLRRSSTRLVGARRLPLARGVRSARQLGAEKIGASLYELRRARSTFPYHFHHGMEEWAIVVEGTPSAARSGRRARAAARATSSAFRPGPPAPISCTGPGTVLMLSASRPLEAIEYPDSGKIGVRPPGRSSASPMPSTTGTANERAVQPLRRRPRGRSGRSARLPARGWSRFGPTSAPSSSAARSTSSIPGDSVCPYHYEHPEEEWLLVLAGRPTLRDPDGEHELAAGDLVCFLEGPEGRTRSRTAPEEPARILMLSTRAKTAVASTPTRQGRRLAARQDLPHERRRRVLRRRALSARPNRPVPTSLGWLS